MRQSSCAGRAEVAEFKLLVVEKDVFNFDVPVRDRWLLTMHMKDTSAEVLEHVDHLLLTKAGRTEFDKKVKKSAFGTELTDDADLMNPRACLFYLSLVHRHYVLMLAQ